MPNSGALAQAGRLPCPARRAINEFRVSKDDGEVDSVRASRALRRPAVCLAPRRHSRCPLPPFRLDVMLGDEIGDARLDLGAEARAVEDAVMADALGEPVLPHLVGKIGAERVRGLGLADAGDVVALAFDGEERGVPDRLGPNRAARDASSVRSAEDASRTPSRPSADRTRRSDPSPPDIRRRTRGAFRRSRRRRRRGAGRTPDARWHGARSSSP